MDIYDMEVVLVLLAVATFFVCWTRHDGSGAVVLGALVANYVASLLLQGSEFHLEAILFMDFCVGVLALDASGRRVWGALVGLSFGAMMALNLAGQQVMVLAWLNVLAIVIIFSQSWLRPQLRGKDIGDHIWNRLARPVALALHRQIGGMVA